MSNFADHQLDRKDRKETEKHFPIKHIILLNSRFWFIVVKTRLPVDKHEDELGAWQQRTSASKFFSFADENENLSKDYQTFCLFIWSRRFRRLPNLQKPAIFRIWKSIKHNFQVYQVDPFQNWHQSNNPQGLPDKSPLFTNLFGATAPPAPRALMYLCDSVDNAKDSGATMIYFKNFAAFSPRRNLCLNLNFGSKFSPRITRDPLSCTVLER